MLGDGFQQGAPPRLHRWVENGGWEWLIAPFDEEVLHHAGVFMGQDAAVEHRFSDEFLEAHADNDRGFGRNPDRILDGAGLQQLAVNRDHLERVHVDMERMALGTAVLAVADDQTPFLHPVEVDHVIHLGDVVLQRVEHEIDAVACRETDWRNS